MTSMLEQPREDASAARALDVPGGAFLWKLAIAAVLLRVGFLAFVPMLGHISPKKFLTFNDTVSYVRYAQHMLDRSVVLDDYNKRMFPGYPAAIAALHLVGVEWTWAAILISMFATPIAIVASSALYRSRIVGLAMLFVPPEWFFYSCAGMSEPLMMALMTLGVLLHMREKPLAGGILLGLSGVVRPMACFAVAGCILVDLMRRRWAKAAKVAIPTLLIVLLGVLLVKLVLGNAAQTVQSYAEANKGHWGGSMISWPGSCLITGPRLSPPAKWKYVQVYGEGAAAVIACVLLLWQALRKRTDLEWMSVPWLWGNTLFVLSVGGIPGFYCLPRYIHPALAPMFFAYRGLLARWKFLWVVLALASAGVMIFIAHRVGGLTQIQ